jgi:hypothetical protein
MALPARWRALWRATVLRGDGGTLYIHVCQHGWDHHRYIWDRSKDDNHYKLMADFDPALASLIEDLAVTPSKATPERCCSMRRWWFS